MISRRAGWTTAAVVLVAAGVTAALLTGGGTSPSPHPSPTPHPVAQRATTAAPSSTPAPPPGPPHDPVVAAAPVRMRISGPAFTVDARVCSMPWAFVLDPPGDQHHTVCWVRNHIGQAPGSATTTSYLLGHSWAPDPQEVLNPLSAPVTAAVLHARPVQMSGRTTYPVHTLDGYRITLWTLTGRLVYTVRQTFGVGKQDWGYLRQVHDGSVPRRIVLTTCAERRGVDYPYNIVVEAYLTSSVATT